MQHESRMSFVEKSSLEKVSSDKDAGLPEVRVLRLEDVIVKLGFEYLFRRFKSALVPLSTGQSRGVVNRVIPCASGTGSLFVNSNYDTIRKRLLLHEPFISF